MYFSDREYGAKPQTEQEFSQVAWGGIVALIVRLGGTGAFGADFPDPCQDGRGTVGTDPHTFRLAIGAEIPGLQPLFTLDQVPPVPLIMDLIEFCHLHVAQPINQGYHDFYHHHHLSFKREEGQAAFRLEVNRILARNGLAYELREDGLAVRLGPPVLRESLIQVMFDTGDRELDQMLESARKRFFDPDPQIRRESLEKLWDAWERIKTLESGDKKEAITRLLNIAAPQEHMREVLEKEAIELTRIGNAFRIRHSETNQVPVDLPTHVDYLFHRLFALIHLALTMRASAAHPNNSIL